MQKALVFSIVMSIKNTYKTFECFKRAYYKLVNREGSSSEQCLFCSMFKHTREEYCKILGYKDGKRVNLSDVIVLLPSWLKHQDNYNLNYKSGKTFSIHSYWFIEFDYLKDMLVNEDIARLTPSFCTKEQRDLIYKVILNTKDRSKEMKKKTKQQKQDNSDIVEMSEKAKKVIDEYHKLAYRKFDAGLIPFDCLHMVEVTFGTERTKRVDNGWTPDHINHKAELLLKTKQDIDAISKSIR